MRAGPAPSGVASVATGEREFDVAGMTCASCAAHIERTLVDHPSVVRAGVNFATNKASVLADPQAVSSEDLIAAIDELGYKLTPHLDDATYAEHDEAEAAERAE